MNVDALLSAVSVLVKPPAGEIHRRTSLSSSWDTHTRPLDSEDNTI